LSKWFLKFADDNRALLENKNISDWYKVAKKFIREKKEFGT